jgi:hypothetical protein
VVLTRVAAPHCWAGGRTNEEDAWLPGMELVDSSARLSVACRATSDSGSSASAAHASALTRTHRHTTLSQCERGHQPHDMAAELNG